MYCILFVHSHFAAKHPVHLCMVWSSSSSMCPGRKLARRAVDSRRSIAPLHVEATPSHDRTLNLATTANRPPRGNAPAHADEDDIMR